MAEITTIKGMSTIKSAEQTRNPEATQVIVEILKDISPEYADYSYSLIDCLEGIIEKTLHILISDDTAEESADAVIYLLAESIEKIHKAIVCDYDNAIEKI